MAIERRILDEIVRQLGAEAKRAELERAIDDSFWFHRSLDRMFARASMTAMIDSRLRTIDAPNPGRASRPSFDHLVRARDDRCGNLKANRFCSF